MLKTFLGSIERGFAWLGSEYHIWLCASKIHILFAVTRSSEVSKKYIFLSPNCPSTGFPSNFGISYVRYSFSGLLSCIVAALVRGQKVSVFVPHISFAIADGRGARLLWQLNALGLLRFYDDGMSVISSCTILHKSGFLPPNASVDAWNYHWRSMSCRGATVDLSLANRALVKAFPDIDLPCIDTKRPTTVHDRGTRLFFADQSGVASIILASNWIDYDALNTALRRSRVDPEDVVYIPHYNPMKNSQAWMATCSVQHCYLPELFLTRLFEKQRCRLYFGVTSTAVYLCELLHRGEIFPFEPIFVGSRGLAMDEMRGEEWDDYVETLSSYVTSERPILCLHDHDRLK